MNRCAIITPDYDPVIVLAWAVAVLPPVNFGPHRVIGVIAFLGVYLVGLMIVG